jgi:hypothetical protein
MVPSTGPVTIQDVVNEFGVVGQPSGTAPHALKEFYSAAAGIPATGELTLFDFRGASAAPPTPIVTEGDGTHTSIGKIQIPYAHYGYAQQRSELEATAPSGSYGSITNGTYNGVTIEAASYWVSQIFEQNFSIILQGNRAKSFFTSVTPEGGNTLTSASSTHSYDSSGNFTHWRWFDSSGGETTVLGAGMAAQWNGSGTSTVTFV